MRERGYREVRIWVPDMRTAAFAAEAKRACAAMNAADARDTDLEAFLSETSWAGQNWAGEW